MLHHWKHRGRLTRALADRLPITSGLKVLSIMWIGQAVSMVGSGLTGFALSVHIYQQSGSVTNMASVSLSGSLPGILLLPFLGVLLDRWDRAFVLKASNIGAGICIFGLLLLLFTGHLTLWVICGLMAIRSVFIAVQGPAQAAAATLLVSKQQLVRANGLTKSLVAGAQTVAPLLAGLLLPIVHIPGILLIDVATYVVALVTLAIIRIPPPPAFKDEIASGTFLKDSVYGWKYIAARPPLKVLLTCGFVVNFGITFGQVLVTPIVLGFSTVEALGTIGSLGGAGMLAGSAVQSIWGGPISSIRGITGLGMLIGFCVLCLGVLPSVWLIGAASFGFWFVIPFSGAYVNAVWQLKTAPAVQGRVFTTRLTIGRSAIPLAQFLAGPLADHFFQPLLVPGGPLTDSVGRVVGVGQGRGAGLLLTLVGLLVVAVHILVYRYTALRALDDLPDLPDATPAMTSAMAPTPTSTSTPAPARVPGSAPAPEAPR